MSSPQSSRRGRRNSLSMDLDLALGEDNVLSVPTVFLIGLSGPHAGKLFKIRAGSSTIGRSSKAFLSLDEKAVSHRHAKLSLDESGCSIEDLGSTNGTFVNDKALSGFRLLVAGDVIRVGSTALGYLTDAEDEQQHTRAMARITAPRLALTAPSRHVAPPPEQDFQIVARGEQSYQDLSYPRPQQDSSPLTEEPNLLDNLLDKIELALSLLKQYWRILLVSSVLLAAAAAAFTYFRPPPANAEFKIYLRQEQTPDPSRANKHDVGIKGGEFFAFAERTFKEPSVIKKSLEDMGVAAGAVQVEQTSNSLEFASADSRGTFRGSYKHPEASFAEQFLSLHLKHFLETEISKALSVLTHEVKLLQDEFDQNENELKAVASQLRDYKEEHLNALPENAISQVSAKVGLLSQRDRLSADLERYSSELALVQKRLSSDDVLASSKVERSRPYDSALSEVRQKIATAQAQGFADEHPELLRLREEERRLSSLKDSAIAAAPSDVTRDANLEYKRLKDRAGDLSVLVQSTKKELGQVHGRLNEIDKIAGAMPEVEADVSALLRKSESKKQTHDRLYQELKAKELELQFERASVAARYEIISPPRAAKTSATKAAVLKAVMGGIAGLFLGAMIAAILWLRDYAIERRVRLASPQEKPA